MPIKNMTEEEQASAISVLEPDLGAVFEENRVRRDIQAALASMDVIDCKIFARIEETSTALRTWLHDDVGLERKGADKIAVAAVVAAWEASQTRTRALQTQRSPSIHHRRSIHCSSPSVGREPSFQSCHGSVAKRLRAPCKVLLGVALRPSG